ncbi:conserved unknown protein [Ectocarpus siliculosus]|uniref:SPX domain-containing protein n=1 Tax=Ectocarpus siliculosus TaxID=2880 RepID=D8LG46_ECTSI|nr:conserved unknown protein [Ectocarpus siliculosus]|eukprot:CBN78945.1 conserved unknown protein [Ectocarpus siliculosus]
MKFAKHLARAMDVSDPEWHPFWVNYKQLKKPWDAAAAAPPASTTGTSTMAAAAATENGASHRGGAEGVAASVNTTREELEPAAAGVALTAAVLSCNPRAAAATGDRAVNGESNSTSSGSGTPPREDKKLACGVRDSCRDGLETASGVRETASSSTAVVLACCGNSSSSCAASAAAAAANASGAAAASPAAALGDDSTAAGAAATQQDAQQGLLLQRRRQCECPFFSALLREVDKCRIFFLENEGELKIRTKRLQLALDHLKRPDLSRLSSVKGAHMKLMQACVNFYRDALLVEDFAMLNYTAVIKLLKKRDKLAGTSDQRPFMAEVMADQPFAMYPGVAKRVVQVEQIFRDIEHMCFLRTGEGMKSVMKNELTVVEAFMQLAQESKQVQHKELHGGASSDPRSRSPSSSSGSAATIQQRQHQRPPLISSQAIDVGWCDRTAAAAAVGTSSGGGNGSLEGDREAEARTGTGARGGPTAASAWARPSSADGGSGGGSASGTTGQGGVAAARINAVKSGEIGGRAGGPCQPGCGGRGGWAARAPTAAAAAVAAAATVVRRAPAPTVVVEGGGRAKPEAEWVLSKHAGWMASNGAVAGGCSRAGEGRCNRLGFQGRGGSVGAGEGEAGQRFGVERGQGWGGDWGAGRARVGQSMPSALATPAPSRQQASTRLSVRPLDSSSGGGSSGGGGYAAGVAAVASPATCLGPRLATSAGLIHHHHSKQARFG